MPKEVEALRTSLDTRLVRAREGARRSETARLARVAHSRPGPCRHAGSRRDGAASGHRRPEGRAEVAAAARAEANAALEAEKVESAALRQVIEGAKQALKQAETALKEERRTQRSGQSRMWPVRAGNWRRFRNPWNSEQAARASQQRELDDALAALEGERGVAAEAVRGSSELEQSLDALRGELAASRSDHEAARRELDDVRAELDTIRGERDAMRAELDSVRSERDAMRGDRESMQRDLEGTRRELDGIRQESEARTPDALAVAGRTGAGHQRRTRCGKERRGSPGRGESRSRGRAERHGRAASGSWRRRSRRSAMPRRRAGSSRPRTRHAMRPRCEAARHDDRSASVDAKPKWSSI